MKVFSAVVPLLLATLGASRSLQSSVEQTLSPAYKVPGDNPLEFCQNPSTYPLEVDAVDLDPNPPKAGQTLHFKAHGFVGKEVQKGAKVQLRVKYNKYITLINVTEDLCDNLPKIDLECPLKKGPLTVEREVKIPGVVPPGSYEAYANLVSADNEVLLCMTATVHFSR